MQRTKKRVKDKFWNFKHPKQRCSVKWLLKRFKPIPGWTDVDIEQLKEREK